MHQRGAAQPCSRVYNLGSRPREVGVPPVSNRAREHCRARRQARPCTNAHPWIAGRRCNRTLRLRRRRQSPRQLGDGLLPRLFRLLQLPPQHLILFLQLPLGDGVTQCLILPQQANSLLLVRATLCVPLTRRRLPRARLLRLPGLHRRQPRAFLLPLARVLRLELDQARRLRLAQARLLGPLGRLLDQPSLARRRRLHQPHLTKRRLLRELRLAHRCQSLPLLLQPRRCLLKHFPLFCRVLFPFVRQLLPFSGHLGS
mmetsp:Transcript_22465/g.72635  ORF Transcript_22465/g.72635 Transcript_22465/m.72635 type:complete len:257 (-) Transcript_22465:150-920(-)